MWTDECVLQADRLRQDQIHGEWLWLFELWLYYMLKYVVVRGMFTYYFNVCT